VAESTTCLGTSPPGLSAPRHKGYDGPGPSEQAPSGSGTIAPCSAASPDATATGRARPADRFSAGRRCESGRRGPPLVLVRRGRDHLGVIQSIAGPVVADAGQCRRRPRRLLPAHARLVSDFPAYGVLVPCPKRAGGRRRGRRTGGVGQAVLVSHRRGERRGYLCDPAAGDVGRHRGSLVRLVDDGRRLADRTARLRRAP
jgi:hypothetical protein